MRKDQLMDTIRNLLQDVLKARFEGIHRDKLARAHGYADGYMRALLDAGLVDKKELLCVVGDERARFVESSETRVAAPTAA